MTDILQMFRILTFSVEHLKRQGTPINEELALELNFQGFDHNDPLEAHMATYVEFLMSDGDRWAELKPQVQRNDQGNSHSPTLGTYQRMLAEYRRIMDGLERGFSSSDYLLSQAELERIANAQILPARRRP